MDNEVLYEHTPQACASRVMYVTLSKPSTAESFSRNVLPSVERFLRKATLRGRNLSVMNKFLVFLILAVLPFTVKANKKYINLELWTKKKQLDCLSITNENGVVNGIYYGSFTTGKENHYFKVKFHSYYLFHDVRQFMFTDVYTSSSIEGLKDNIGSIHFGVWRDFNYSDFGIDFLEFFTSGVKVYERNVDLYSSNLMKVRTYSLLDCLDGNKSEIDSEIFDKICSLP